MILSRRLWDALAALCVCDLDLRCHCGCAFDTTGTRTFFWNLDVCFLATIELSVQKCHIGNSLVDSLVPQVKTKVQTDNKRQNWSLFVMKSLFSEVERPLSRQNSIAHPHAV
jgi:hypothetical protein